MSDDPLKTLAELGGIKETPKRAPKRTEEEKGIFFRVDAAVYKQFRTLAIERGRSQQHLAGEALNLLFAQYGKPQIADGGER